MKCLWLTRKYPRPTNSGELIYSNGLIRSFAATGAELTVLAHDNDELPVGDGSEASSHVDEDSVEWRLGAPGLGGRFASLFTKFPSDSWRLKNGGPEKALEVALKTENWDAIIIDHAAIGWALDAIQAHQSRANGEDPVLVYVSHNHEAKIRREIAKNSNDPLPKKLALQYDAEKYARQEDRLCREVDLVTAITEAEVEAYRQNFPDQRYISLTPGYDGPIHRDRPITDEIPRRVVMSGSFEWIAKRLNLELFLEKAAKPFADAGIELQIVGKTEETFRQEMIQRFPDVDFVGRVPEMEPYLLNSRMGLIVEEFGGGFKLKTLEYIFHGLPLAGLFHAVEGLPLSSPDDILLTDDTSSLIKAVSEVIDDFDRLNEMRRHSIEVCEASFRWEDRGRKLFEEIRELRSVVLAG